MNSRAEFERLSLKLVFAVSLPSESRQMLAHLRGSYCEVKLKNNRAVLRPIIFWPARQDSNLRPSESESDALSSCATGRYLIKTCGSKSYCEFYQEAKMLACKGIFATPSITQACESTGRAKPETCESKSYCVIITHFSPDCKHFLAKSFVFFFYFRLQD